MMEWSAVTMGSLRPSPQTDPGVVRNWSFPTRLPINCVMERVQTVPVDLIGFTFGAHECRARRDGFRAVVVAALLPANSPSQTARRLQHEKKWEMRGFLTVCKS